MTIMVWIRHAKKQWKNGKGKPKHDPPLKKGQEKEILQLSKKLIEKYGPPTQIYVSPYRRTRETLYLLTSEIEKKYKVYVNPELGEYLGNQPECTFAELHDSTLEFIDPPENGKEDLKGLKKRALNEKREIEKDMKKNDVVWVITHGALMGQVYNKVSGGEKRKFKESEAFAYDVENKEIDLFSV